MTEFNIMNVLDSSTTKITFNTGDTLNIKSESEVQPGGESPVGIDYKIKVFSGSDITPTIISLFIFEGQGGSTTFNQPSGKFQVFVKFNPSIEQIPVPFLASIVITTITK